VNDQGCLPIANRGDVSNFAEREGRIYDAVVAVLRRAFQQSDFAEWVEKLRSARREREREAERAQMERRRQEVVAWVSKKSPGSLDASEARLAPLDPEEPLRLREPRNEQELFYLYAQLSARFEVPAFILEYNTHEGVDAVGRVSVPKLLPGGSGYARIEFKYEVESGYPIGHYFDAIDLIICWSVGKPGPIDEEAAAGLGKLRRRPNPVLTPPFDTHEIAYDSSNGERVIPVLQLRELFASSKAPPKRGSKG
jgi:hypothetical protein